MLTPELVNQLLQPISAEAPCGENLEYDPAFTALEASAQGKPEQQFGDTVIAAIEPDWPAVAEQAQALLLRTKDLRPAVLLTRAATRQQGLPGLLLGLQLIEGLLDRHWDTLHPLLDAEDNNDPTMRVNALMPLSDDAMLPRDLYDARVGMARSFGALRVRDIAATHGALAASEQTPSLAQVLGALSEIQLERPALAQELAALDTRIAALSETVRQRSGRSDLLDLTRLAATGKLLAQVARSIAPDAEAGEPPPSATEESAGAAAPGATAGALRTRQDALRLLDAVIDFLQRTEPGNPAPLLIARAKQLIGVSFIDIVHNLAPGALDAIETVVGRQQRQSDD